MTFGDMGSLGKIFSSVERSKIDINETISNFLLYPVRTAFGSRFTFISDETYAEVIISKVERVIAGIIFVVLSPVLIPVTFIGAIVAYNSESHDKVFRIKEVKDIVSKSSLDDSQRKTVKDIENEAEEFLQKTDNPQSFQDYDKKIQSTHSQSQSQNVTIEMEIKFCSKEQVGSIIEGAKDNQQNIKTLIKFLKPSSTTNVEEKVKINEKLKLAIPVLSKLNLLNIYFDDFCTISDAVNLMILGQGTLTKEDEELGKIKISKKLLNGTFFHVLALTKSEFEYIGKHFPHDPNTLELLSSLLKQKFPATESFVAVLKGIFSNKIQDFTSKQMENILERLAKCNRTIQYVQSPSINFTDEQIIERKRNVQEAFQGYNLNILSASGIFNTINILNLYGVKSMPELIASLAKDQVEKLLQSEGKDCIPLIFSLIGDTKKEIAKKCLAQLYSELPIECFKDLLEKCSRPDQFIKDLYINLVIAAPYMDPERSKIITMEALDILSELPNRFVGAHYNEKMLTFLKPIFLEMIKVATNEQTSSLFMMGEQVKLDCSTSAEWIVRESTKLKYVLENETHQFLVTLLKNVDRSYYGKPIFINELRSRGVLYEILGGIKNYRIQSYLEDLTPKEINHMMKSDMHYYRITNSINVHGLKDDPETIRTAITHCKVPGSGMSEFTFSNMVLACLKQTIIDKRLITSDYRLEVLQFHNLFYREEFEKMMKNDSVEKLKSLWMKSFALDLNFNFK